MVFASIYHVSNKKYNCKIRILMQIDVDLLFSWGAIAKKYKRNEVVFNENELAQFYFQIIEGSVRMFNSMILGYKNLILQSQFWFDISNLCH